PMPVLCETMIPDSYFLSKSLSVNCNYIYNTIKASQKGQEKRIFLFYFQISHQKNKKRNRKIKV
ncbi:hypothetical protein, partial [Bacteroides finegoldii]|uniref:hypothetical protein n=1 Tax=Bacteroides finegoldii TaxID=338188 RepID=UPI001E5627FE